MPVPGLIGSDHLGITVPDLDEADDFFVRILGAERFYDLGPFEHPDDDWMREHLNVDPRTVMRRLRFYRLRTGVNLEVFEYEAVGPHAIQPPLNSDVGGHHLALYVEDMDAAVAYLRAEGIRVLGDPTASSGASSGQRWVYFLSPWGMQFELVSFPSGKAYEEGLTRLLWDPRDPAR